MTNPSPPNNRDFANSCQAKGLYIGGSWHPGSGGTFEVFNPANGQVWSQAPECTRDDAKTAIDAAAASQSAWAALPFSERARLLL